MRHACGATLISLVSGNPFHISTRFLVDENWREKQWMLKIHHYNKNNSYHMKLKTWSTSNKFSRFSPLDKDINSNAFIGVG